MKSGASAIDEAQQRANETIEEGKVRSPLDSQRLVTSLLTYMFLGGSATPTGGRQQRRRRRPGPRQPRGCRGEEVGSHGKAPWGQGRSNNFGRAITILTQPTRRTILQTVFLKSIRTVQMSITIAQSASSLRSTSLKSVVISSFTVARRSAYMRGRRRL